MSKTTPLEPDRTYHVFNRGVNRGKLFTQKRHYFRFIENIFKYLPPICTIHAWCLIENHFHMLIQTKTKQELIQKNFIHKGSTEDEIINKNHQQISNLFNAYARYFNIQQDRSGPLFDTRIKKDLVTTQEHFHNLIIYIHNNPAHHNICKQPEKYAWSSFYHYLNVAKRKPFMTENINEFGGIDGFLEAHHKHQQKINFKHEIV